MLPELSRDEILRYSRHLLIPEVGLEDSASSRAHRFSSLARAGLVRQYPFIWQRQASVGSGLWITMSSIHRIYSGR